MIRRRSFVFVSASVALLYIANKAVRHIKHLRLFFSGFGIDQQKAAKAFGPNYFFAVFATRKRF